MARFAPLDRAVYRVLLVEDDDRLAHLVVSYLHGHGFEVERVREGHLVHSRIQTVPPDIVLLDLGLPDVDGLDLCREVRALFKGLLCIFSARADDLHQIVGLELGADDYIAKPIDPRLLVARLRAHVRRVRAQVQPDVLRFGRLQIDLGCREVMLSGEAVELTTAEFDLLLVLARNAGRTMGREALFLALRGIDFDGLDRSIDARVSRLRRKLGDNDCSPARIKTVRGKGYLFSQAGW